MKEWLTFFKNYPKSVSEARKCKGENCLTPLEFHIWRFWKFYIKPKYKL